MKCVSILAATVLCLVATTVCSAKRATGSSMPAPRVSCSGHGGGDSMSMQDAEESPLYKLLQSKLGEPVNCSITKSDGNEVFTVDFAKGATLTFTDNETLETSIDEVVLPAGSAMVSFDETVKTLKAVEKDDDPKGMGVKWDKLKASGDGDFTTEGKTCNAKAHVHVSGGVVVGFGFSSAC